VSLRQTAGGENVLTSLTYAGAALTKIDTADEGNRVAELWYRIAPSSGTNTVSATLSGSGLLDFGIAAISFTGADQTTPVGTPTLGTGTSTTPSVAVNSASGDIVVDCVCVEHSGTFSVGAGQTARWNGIATNGFIKYAGSTETGGGTVTMSWSNTSSQAWAQIGVAVKPVAAVSAGNSSNLLLLGVG
jgi:hypothetical protein